jgi:hypothetical protein
VVEKLVEKGRKKGKDERKAINLDHELISN